MAFEDIVLVNLRDCKDWGKEGDVRIDRRSKFGNPFVMKEEGDRLKVIEQYEEYIGKRGDLVKELASMQPKRLGCWCYPKPCHGHVLIRLLKRS